MRITLLSLATIVASSNPDPCETLCDEYTRGRTGAAEDLCGPSGSRCVEAVCTSLYWTGPSNGQLLYYDVAWLTDETVPEDDRLTDEERANPVTCRRARELVSHRYPRPARSTIAQVTEVPRVTEVFSAPSLVPAQSFPGVRGITNLGNNCYLSTALQLLTHITPFRAMLGSVSEQHGWGLVEPNPFMLTLLDLVNQMNEAGESSLSPNGVRGALGHMGYPRFSDGAAHVYQESTPELLEAISMSMGMMIDGGANVVDQILSVSVQRAPHCAACESVPLEGPQITHQQSISLPHAGGSAPSLTDLLHNVFVPSASHNCHVCQTPLVSSFQISELREVVEIQIERAVAGSPITLPADGVLDFSPFLTPGSVSHANPLYRLVGIAHHSHGHYRSQFAHLGVWYSVDDHVVQRMGAAAPSGQSRSAQILYFERI